MPKELWEIKFLIHKKGFRSRVSNFRKLGQQISGQSPKKNFLNKPEL